VLKTIVDKAQALNNFFTTAFTKETPTIFNPTLPPRGSLEITSACPNLISKKCTIFSVRLIHSNYLGLDNIPGRLLKKGAPWIAEPLAKHFNLSMATDQLPKNWARPI